MNTKTEIICVGNEILIGKTLNTNAHWLANKAHSLGVEINRMTVVRDDVNEIAAAVHDALNRNPRFIITTGGLGPTFDDKTLEGIAKGLGRRFVVNEKALALVRSKYETLLEEGRIEKVELTAARVKMATFPEKAEPLRNSVGTAPGMLTKVKESFIIALPGVPPEMEAIFDESVIPMLKKAAGKSAFFETSLYLDGINESSLAPLIDKVMNDNPLVYIKSHVYMKSIPQIEGKKSHIEVHFSTTAKNRRIGENRLRRASAQMSALAKKSGGRVSISEAGKEVDD